MREENKAMLTVLLVVLLVWILGPIAAAYEQYLRIRSRFGGKSDDSV